MIGHGLQFSLEPGVATEADKRQAKCWSYLSIYGLLCVLAVPTPCQPYNTMGTFLNRCRGRVVYLVLTMSFSQSLLSVVLVTLA